MTDLTGSPRKSPKDLWDAGRTVTTVGIPKCFVGRNKSIYSKTGTVSNNYNLPAKRIQKGVLAFILQPNGTDHGSVISPTLPERAAPVPGAIVASCLKTLAS